MHYVYILYSPSIDRYYTGETSNISDRFEMHLNGTFKGSYTTRAKDWVLKLSIPFSNITSAKKAEAFIKRMNSRIFIEKLILDHKWLIQKFDT